MLSRHQRRAILSYGSPVSALSMRSPQDWPIGVFDSGVGGLTVLRALQHQLPQESFVYFGDTAHVPYGNRTPSDIQTLARQILDWLVQHPVKMAIMACNTSSALALDLIRPEFEIPILGVILPGARAAVQTGRRIGVIATPATVASDCYPQAILEIDPTVDVFQMACPEFVPLIESNQILHPSTRSIVWHRLQPLLEAEIDTLVYGCTHYPHLAPIMAELLPSQVTVVDPATQMAVAVAQELDLLNLKSSCSLSPTRFFVSGNPDYFAHTSQDCLGFMPQVGAVHLPGLAIAGSSPTLVADEAILGW
ncbi:MAG: glutamate racemase [Thermosynechococcaceae cyanobacterium]